MNYSSKAGDKAFKYHQSGFHCAEAVSKAIIEEYGDLGDDCVPKVATAFGGGVGRTHQEMCGALAGGMIGIGFLHGRSQPEADWTLASQLAARLRERFIDCFGTTHCGSLLKQFGHQENMMRCKQLTAEVADMLADILDSITK